MTSSALPLINQNQLNKLLVNYTTDATCSFADLLTTSGYATNLENLTFNTNTLSPINYNFSGIDFTNVHFKGNYNYATFSGNFEKCDFINATLIKAHFVDSNFNNSVILKSDFSACTYDNVNWSQSIALHSSFIDTQFKDGSFNNSILGGNNYKGCIAENVNTSEVYLLENSKLDNKYNVYNEDLDIFDDFKLVSELPKLIQEKFQSIITKLLNILNPGSINNEASLDTVFKAFTSISEDQQDEFLDMMCLTECEGALQKAFPGIFPENKTLIELYLQDHNFIDNYLESSHKYWDITNWIDDYIDNRYGEIMSSGDANGNVFFEILKNFETVEAMAQEWYLERLSNENEPQAFLINATHTNIVPHTGILGYPIWHDNAFYGMQNKGSIVETLNPYSHSIDVAQLTQEVDAVLYQIETNGLSYTSIAQQILATNTPTIQEIKYQAKAWVDNIDGLWIPGSVANVNPAFYGENLHDYTYSFSLNDDYTTEIFEFALIQETLNQNKALMGVCHGMQIINVYLGGTIHQFGYGQYGVNKLEQVEHDGLLGSIIDGEIRGSSMHGQAVNQLADNLQLVFMQGDTIKGAQANDGSKIMVTQFHPENEIDENNINIVKQFVKISNINNINNAAINLSDVLSLDTDFLNDCLESLNDNYNKAPESIDKSYEKYDFEGPSSILSIPVLIEDQIMISAAC